MGGNMNYIPDLYEFLRRLDQNNDRPWFTAHKAEFDHFRQLWYADLQRLIAAIGEWWPEVAHLTPQSIAFRIYRDTRFSLDKTPYKTFFSAAISPQGKAAHAPGFYIHQGPNGERNTFGSGLYGGIWCPDSAVLKKLRKAIVDNAEEWESIVNPLNKIYPGWCGERLKRAPAGWPLDHPMIEYLRLKEFGKYRQLDEKFFSQNDWPERSAMMLKPLKPLIDFIRYSIDEE